MNASRVQIAPDLMRHFERSPGRTIYVDELARAVGATELQVQKSIGNIIKKPLWSEHLAVVVRGRAWRFQPIAGQPASVASPEPAEAVTAAVRPEQDGCQFRQLGVASNGDLILEMAGEPGGLYRASPL